MLVPRPGGELFAMAQGFTSELQEIYKQYMGNPGQFRYRSVAAQILASKDRGRANRGQARSFAKAAKFEPVGHDRVALTEGDENRVAGRHPGGRCGSIHVVGTLEKLRP
jgi:hypothetical protein